MWSFEEIEQRIDQAVAWLQMKTREAKADGLVIGISGGVDSAVVAGLCKRAFPENAIGVILPCYSSQEDIEDGRLVAQSLNIRMIEIELSEVHSLVMKQLEESLAPIQQDMGRTKMTQGNLKARLRMSSLYAVANQLNYLVVGTDNAPESYTGYFTKYGDGGVDLLPLSSLTKSEVRMWARALGLPEQISERVPTAGLWPGQTDEGQMGITYDLIDRYLLGETIPQEVVDKIEHMHQISEHKRNMPPSLELPKLKSFD